ncbi:MAG TPA: M20/M25/M40 family metallo-hydrolase [Oscillospiraceae bacterium]|nr:M20/M25/M40 family metallo-hydrolase [Oscillospiraceae bacterium]
MYQSIPDAARALRFELHELAERSGEEKRTKARLMAFLRENTSLDISDEGAWFCALHGEPGAAETIAFRADMDALPRGEGASHLCGHDGHSAVLAGLGLFLEGKTLGRNILLLFQHAEETGAGGAVCSRALTRYGVRRVYAFHNIPGYPVGAVLLRRGTFACASRGMVLSFSGAGAHAAYPEYGRNPGFAAARLIAALPALTAGVSHSGLLMATLVGAKIGEEAFGSAAGRAEVFLTLRAGRDGELAALVSAIEDAARAQAGRDGVEAAFSFKDVFPATENDPGTLARLENVCRAEGLSCIELPEPFRWSEDFGYYGRRAEAAMVGIGAGEDWPQLHTDGYVFNDAVLPVALRLFSALAERG